MSRLRVSCGVLAGMLYVVGAASADFIAPKDIFVSGGVTDGAPIDHMQHFIKKDGDDWRESLNMPAKGNPGIGLMKCQLAWQAADGKAVMLLCKEQEQGAVR